MNPIWRDTSIRILEYIPLSSTMQVFFSTSDIEPNGNITEAGIDHFYVAESSVLSLDEVDTEIKVYPNPTKGVLSIEGVLVGEEYQVLGVNGKLLSTGSCDSLITDIDMSKFESGAYFLVIGNDTFKILKAN